MTIPRTELTSPILIVCSLDGEGQRARLEEWSRHVNRATSREALSDGLRYTFAAGDDVEARIRELVAAEQGCCSFLRFEVTRVVDQIEMNVRAPADGLEALRFIFAAPAPPTGERILGQQKGSKRSKSSLRNRAQSWCASAADPHR